VAGDDAFLTLCLSLHYYYYYCFDWGWFCCRGCPF
jgi:hypothetical protein